MSNRGYNINSGRRLARRARGLTATAVRLVGLVLLGLLYIYSLFFSHDALYFSAPNDSYPKQIIQTNPTQSTSSSLQIPSNEKNNLYTLRQTANVNSYTEEETDEIILLRSLENRKCCVLENSVTARIHHQVML